MATAHPTFRFVYIPADSSQPLEELTQELEPGKEVECLTHRLQEHFRQTSAGANAASKEARRAMLAQHMKGAPVTDEMLDTVGNMQMVESVTLLSGGPDNGFTHVNLYVDDTGSLKQLPPNARAAGLAAAAGHPCEVHGDAFVGRTVDSDDAFARLDFTLAEVSSDAVWVGEARARNARRREAGARAASLAPQAQVIHPGAEAAAEAAEDALLRPVADGRYSLSQDDSEVVVEVRVPPATKPSDVDCLIAPSRLRLRVRTLAEAEASVLDGPLCRRVRAEESSWSLSSAGGERLLTLTLSKAAPGRWASVLAAS